ncbi:lantibiotic dehydratase [Xylanimonas oleitrophica]|uniref:lantibiotic dehydratase n=1 Tax=Xylanimonas oleitrophica TaxID=2607479 RepID=UPI001FE340C5|nr:lantibiotic dehydratase [Xylanimonas oleitrophica]
MLRSAGFPASLATLGSDPALLDAALAATSPGDPTYREAYGQATRRHLEALQRVAQLPLLREAVTWQNPALVASCLDPLSRATRRNSPVKAKGRTVTSYLQRYCLKNDSISFFGPIAWFGIDPAGSALEAVPGDHVVRCRTTHFELWAVDAVADALAAQVPDRGMLPVWRSLGSVLDGDVLRRPNGTTVLLSEDERQVWAAADGTCSSAGAGVPAAVERLERLRVVRVGFSVQVGAWPERELRAQVQALGDADVRDRLTGQLDALCQLKDAVGMARDSATLQAANAALEAAFVALTGRAASRRAGQTYAGRTLVYQEATRDVDVQVGARVLDALAGPLEVLLQAADWLVVEIAQRYRTFVAEWVERECARAGRDYLPFSYVIARLTPELTETAGGLPRIITEVTAELQQRWSRVLPVDPVERRKTVRAADLVAACRREFPARDFPAGFGTCHSPDFIIDAPSVKAVADGAFRIVLGELHVGINSIESRAFVEQHPSPQSLVALAERTAAGTRTVSIPPKSSPFVTSRAAPPTAMTSPQFRYFAWYDEEAPLRPAGEHLPGGELVVRAADGVPVVESVVDGATYDVVDLLSDALTAITVNAFQPVPLLPHSPRITVDDVVIARERWSVDVADATWAAIDDEAERFWAAQQWRRAHDLPVRVFVKSPLETKPFAVDLANLSSVASFASALGALARAGRRTVTLTEQLPELGKYWLTDRHGEGYTSEMRVVALRSRPEDEA